MDFKDHKFDDSKYIKIKSDVRLVDTREWVKRSEYEKLEAKCREYEGALNSITRLPIEQIGGIVTVGPFVNAKAWDLAFEVLAKHKEG